MPLWPIILGATLTSGLLLLHGFAKAKQTGEHMLDTYDRMLQDSRLRKEAEKAAEKTKIETAKPAEDTPLPARRRRERFQGRPARCSRDHAARTRRQVIQRASTAVAHVLGSTFHPRSSSTVKCCAP